MACTENQVIYESCLEQFWELLEDYDFKCTIGEHFLSAQEQWREKEYGRMDEYAYEWAFDILWSWDCEALSRDIKGCVEQYVNLKTQGKIKNG